MRGMVDNFHSLIVDPMDQCVDSEVLCGISDEEYRRTFALMNEFLGKNKAPAIAINPPIASNSKRSGTKVVN